MGKFKIGDRVKNLVEFEVTKNFFIIEGEKGVVTREGTIPLVKWDNLSGEDEWYQIEDELELIP